mmetsp:Transcript_19453/g.48727  ORF Transcript_19453/g.48727 Transcript_19453/m.48727 type:complete len:387 (-) Transcript_19453:1235-2395(-)
MPWSDRHNFFFGDASPRTSNRLLAEHLHGAGTASSSEQVNLHVPRPSATKNHEEHEDEEVNPIPVEDSWQLVDEESLGAGGGLSDDAAPSSPSASGGSSTDISGTLLEVEDADAVPAPKHHDTGTAPEPDAVVDAPGAEDVDVLGCSTAGHGLQTRKATLAADPPEDVLSASHDLEDFRPEKLSQSEEIMRAGLQYVNENNNYVGFGGYVNRKLREMKTALGNNNNREVEFVSSEDDGGDKTQTKRENESTSGAAEDINAITTDESVCDEAEMSSFCDLAKEMEDPPETTPTTLITAAIAIAAYCACASSTNMFSWLHKTDWTCFVLEHCGFATVQHVDSRLDFDKALDWLSARGPYFFLHLHRGASGSELAVTDFVRKFDSWGCL